MEELGDLSFEIDNIFVELQELGYEAKIEAIKILEEKVCKLKDSCNVPLDIPVRNFLSVSENNIVNVIENNISDDNNIVNKQIISCAKCTDSGGCQCLENIETKNKNERKEFECANCCKKLKTSKSLKRHTKDPKNCLRFLTLSVTEMSLECPYNHCDYKTHQKGNLRDHMVIHTDKYQCKTCNKSFSRRSRLERHERFQKNCQDVLEGKSQALIADTKSSTERAFKPQNFSDGNLQCMVCGKDFSSNEKLTLHQDECKPTVLDGKFCCRKCDFKTSEEEYLQRHMIFHNSRKYPCHICNRVFFKESKLAAHKMYPRNCKKKVVGFHNLKCNNCLHVFANTTKYNAHVANPENCLKFLKQNSQKGAQNEGMITRKEKLEKEQKKQMLTQDKTEAFVNRIEEKDDRQIFCDRAGCGYRTKTRKCLSEHIRYKHRNEESSNNCNENSCSFKGKITLDLIKHKKSELRRSENRGVSCPESGCDFSTKKRRYLTWHIRVKHSEDPSMRSQYTCSNCKHIFGRKRDLETHETNTANCEKYLNQMKCQNCGKVFFNKLKFKRHRSSFGNCTKHLDKKIEEKESKVLETKSPLKPPPILSIEMKSEAATSKNQCSNCLHVFSKAAYYRNHITDIANCKKFLGPMGKWGGGANQASDGLKTDANEPSDNFKKEHCEPMDDSKESLEPTESSNVDPIESIESSKKVPIKPSDISKKEPTLEELLME